METPNPTRPAADTCGPAAAAAGAAAGLTRRGGRGICSRRRRPPTSPLGLKCPKVLAGRGPQWGVRGAEARGVPRAESGRWRRPYRWLVPYGASDAGSRRVSHVTPHGGEAGSAAFRRRAPLPTPEWPTRPPPPMRVGDHHLHPAGPPLTHGCGPYGGHGRPPCTGSHRRRLRWALDLAVAADGPEMLRPPPGPRQQTPADDGRQASEDARFPTV